MKKITIKIVACVVLCGFPRMLFATFDFNANCLKAYQYIFEMKLTTAKQLIAAEKKAHPQNAIIPFLENYVDFFYLLSSDNKQDADRMEANKIKRLEQIKNDNPKSPYYLYTQAEIILQWGLIKGRYGSYYGAARDINRANNLLEENQQKFPAFHLNAKGLGLIQTIMGSIPEGFLKSTLSALGIKGNMESGVMLLDRLAENLPRSAYEPFYEEVVFYYVYVLNDVVRSPNAYSKTMKYTARFADSSLLKTYLQAYSALRSGHNEEAIRTLEDRPTGAAYPAVPYLDYLMGIARLNKLDDTAASYFEKFIQQNKGVSYIKDAYLHLSWIHLLKGNMEGYFREAAKVKTQGYVYNERDKQALNEARAPAPDRTLLSARLLNDGGYLNAALHELNEVSPERFTSTKDKTEYYYRLGRIYHGLNKEDLALKFYQLAIQQGKNLTSYYAAKAGVFMGTIYEERKDYVRAKNSFTQVIGLKNHEYKSGIENEARQGLKRIP